MAMDSCATSDPSPEANLLQKGKNPFWWIGLQLFKLPTHPPSTFLQTWLVSSSDIWLRNSGLTEELQRDLTLLLACKWRKACSAITGQHVFLQDECLGAGQCVSRFSCSPSCNPHNNPRQR